MNLIERIRGVFHKNEEAMPLEKALERVNAGIESHKREALHNVYGRTEKIHSGLRELYGLLDAFEQAEVRDKRAKASESVKDRFCKYAKDQIIPLAKPEKDMEAVKAFIGEASAVMQSLGGLTPKQMMHIKFFFSDEIGPVSKKIAEINSLLEETHKLASPEKLGAFLRIRKTAGRIEELDAKIKESLAAIEATKSMIETLKKGMESICAGISSIDTRNFSVARDLISDAENRKSLAEQSADSYLAFGRALKKLKHEKNMNDTLLDAYIESPGKALLADEDLRIIRFMKSLIALHEKGGIDLEKRLGKAESVVNSAEYLKTMRLKIIAAEKELQERKKYFNDEIKPLIDKKEKLEKEKADSEVEMNGAAETAAKLKRDISHAEKEKSELLESLKAELSKELETRVV